MSALVFNLAPYGGHITLALVLAMGMGPLTTGCVSTTWAKGLHANIELWQHGRPGAALKMATAEYQRFQNANALSDEKISRGLEAANLLLSEVPLLSAGQPQMPQPELSEDGSGARTLLDALRADLLSTGVTRVIRAVRQVRAMEIQEEIPSLMMIIYRGEVFLDDKGVLEGHSNALRSVVAKRAALDALITLLRTSASVESTPW